MSTRRCCVGVALHLPSTRASRCQEGPVAAVQAARFHTVPLVAALAGLCRGVRDLQALRGLTAGRSYRRPCPIGTESFRAQSHWLPVPCCQVSLDESRMPSLAQAEALEQQRRVDGSWQTTTVAVLQRSTGFWPPIPPSHLQSTFLFVTVRTDLSFMSGQQSRCRASSGKLLLQFRE